MKADSKQAYNLIHKGAQALSIVEGNGIRVDTEYLTNTIKEINKKISRIESGLKKSRIWTAWKQRFGKDASLGSGEQLAYLLVSDFGKTLPETEKSTPKKIRYASSGSALLSTGLKFCTKYVELEKLKQTVNTFLSGIQREVDPNGFLHPFFNLHTAKTFRSSSDNPNFQNLPIRDPVQGALVRKCFIPRPGRVLVEIDYGGIEVCIAACYHKDPVMLEYIKNPEKDMHRDMAAQSFLCDTAQVSKMMRYAGKNMFVFPQFYGDYYGNNASAMWEYIQSYDLKLEGCSTSVLSHLAKQGIDRLGSTNDTATGSFMGHMQSVEKDFWERRFPVYNNWKKSWWDSYKRNGSFRTLTGFYLDGLMGKNDAINYPVQGSAFHCLLWSLIRIQAILSKRKMKTLIVGQIHDSIVADVPATELYSYLKLAKHVMTVQLLKKWPWIIVPLTIEAEVTPKNGSWNEKKEVKIP